MKVLGSHGGHRFCALKNAKVDKLIQRVTAKGREGFWRQLKPLHSYPKRNPCKSSRPLKEKSPGIVVSKPPTKPMLCFSGRVSPTVVVGLSGEWFEMIS